MTNFEYIKSLNSEEAAFVIIKAIDECAVYHPFVDNDDDENLVGNPCFENFKEWLNRKRNAEGGK